jgi:hypothetical protein
MRELNPAYRPPEGGKEAKNKSYRRRRQAAAFELKQV